MARHRASRRPSATWTDRVPRGPSLAVAMAWTAGVALLFSTQFLAQPFVWRNWALPEVLDGWAHVAADRLLVAIPIGACVWLASQARPGRPGDAVILVGLAVVLGACLGEVLRVRLDPFADRPDAPAIAGRIIHWTLLGAVSAGILAFWRLHADLDTIAAEAGAADARARRMLLASELEALQRQIEPHFLFNTLATIKRFGETAPDEALSLLDRLFDYLSRIFAASSAKRSSLGDELDLVTTYLQVCAVRMGPRLEVVDRIDPALRGCDLPPLMLGTLVENAVRHGLAPLPRGGTITLSAQVDGTDLEVCVADDGMGLQSEDGAGIGLANLAARLRLLYGERGSIRLEAPDCGGVRAVLRLPHAPAV